MGYMVEATYHLNKGPDFMRTTRKHDVPRKPDMRNPLINSASANGSYCLAENDITPSLTYQPRVNLEVYFCFDVEERALTMTRWPS